MRIFLDANILFCTAGALALLPEKDRPVLAAAIRGKCEALVTGDISDFGPLFGKSVQGVKIHSTRSSYRALFG